MEKLNTIAYIIYLLITTYITVVVGKSLHHHGKPYLHDIFDGKETLYNAINNILLTGYYLLNVGYALLMLQSWEVITNYVELVEAITYKSGIIIITLGIIHYNNLMTFTLVKHFKNKKIFQL
jgi:hypothetical protein